MRQYVLGIDIGSGSVKLTLLGNDGVIGAAVGCEYPISYPQVGWAEQKPEDWCLAFRKAFGELMKRTGIWPEMMGALFPDTTTHTAVLLDEKKQPIGNAIHWTDQRSEEEVEELNRNHLGEILEKTLNQPTMIWTLPQMMWLRRHEPEKWGQIRHLLFAKDYLRYRLTRELGTGYIDAVGSMFYDAVGQGWSEPLCRIAGTRMDWLPRASSPEEIAGYVTKQVAGEFELAEGTRVLTGTSDTAMEMMAAGSVEPEHATMKLATAGRICVVTEQFKQSPYLFNYRHMVPGLWYPGMATSSCAASLRWYRDSIGRESFGELCEKAQEILSGSEGLIFHPYLQGELMPYNDSSLRASYVGVSSRHTTEHFTRATLEGIAHSMKDCMNVITGLGIDMSRLRVIGGGAKSGLWRQIVADVLGMSLEKTETDDFSFGSAIMAAVGAGWYRDVREAVEACVRIRSIIHSIPERDQVYENAFHRYRRIQQALEEIYRE